MVAGVPGLTVGRTITWKGRWWEDEYLGFYRR